MVNEPSVFELLKFCCTMDGQMEDEPNPIGYPQVWGKEKKEESISCKSDFMKVLVVNI